MKHAETTISIHFYPEITFMSGCASGEKFDVVFAFRFRLTVAASYFYLCFAIRTCSHVATYTIARVCNVCVSFCSVCVHIIRGEITLNPASLQFVLLRFLSALCGAICSTGRSLVVLLLFYLFRIGVCWVLRCTATLLHLYCYLFYIFCTTDNSAVKHSQKEVVYKASTKSGRWTFRFGTMYIRYREWESVRNCLMAKYSFECQL